MSVIARIREAGPRLRLPVDSAGRVREEWREVSRRAPWLVTKQRHRGIAWDEFLTDYTDDWTEGQLVVAILREIEAGYGSAAARDAAEHGDHLDAEATRRCDDGRAILRPMPDHLGWQATDAEGNVLAEAGDGFTLTAFLMDLGFDVTLQREEANADRHHEANRTTAAKPIRPRRREAVSRVRQADLRAVARPDPACVTA